MNNYVNTIINDNNMNVIKKMPDNSVCTILSDIPYALCEIDALKMIKDGIDNKGDFMGKKWLLPTTEMLTEFNRVLKDGGFFVTTFTARQDLQCVLQYRLLEAGFDISFSSIIWNFQTGFPKAANFSKISQKRSGVQPDVVGSRLSTSTLTKRQIDGNRNNNAGFDSGGSHIVDITKPTTDEAKYMEGLYSCQLKPAYEPIIIAQKRYKEKSKIDHITTWYNERKALLDSGIAEEDLSLYTKNSSGAVSIDLARIPIENLESEAGYRPNAKNYNNNNGDTSVFGFGGGSSDNGYHNSQGRFPATILVSNNAMDVFRITKSSDAVRHNNNKINPIFIGNDSTTFGHKDQGDLSRYFSLDAWVKKNQPELYKLSQKALELQHDTEIIYPFLNTSKPSQAEANAGLDGFDVKEVDCRTKAGKGCVSFASSKNTHCTKKPIALFSYLITLFSSKENDIILDPFCGSGATCIASVLTNRKYIGIDMSKEYCDITEARVKYWQDLKNAKVDSEPEVDKQADLF